MQDQLTCPLRSRTAVLLDAAIRWESQGHRLGAYLPSIFKSPGNGSVLDSGTVRNHSFRHAFARHLCDHGMSQMAARYLHHADVRLIHRIYAASTAADWNMGGILGQQVIDHRSEMAPRGAGPRPSYLGRRDAQIRT